MIILVYMTQRNFIYFPTQTAVTPREAGVPEMDEVAVTTEDGLTLKAWYKPPQNAEHPTLIYFHGNAGDIADRTFLMKSFLKEDFGVLLMTYRGYSGNPGNPTEKGLYHDARAALRFLIDKESEYIFAFGHSIGTAVAIQMASEFALKGLILQSPFPSLTEVGNYHFPFLPIYWLIKDRYDISESASKLKIPKLVIIGLDDTIVPPEISLKLHEILPEPKTLKKVPHRGHNELFEPEIIIDFIKSTAAPHKDISN